MATLPYPVAGHDEVDRIVAAWGRERPDLDVAPIGVFSRVSRLARLLDLARRASFGVSELDTWEFDVLSALRRSGSPYRLSVSYTHLRAHETRHDLVCRLLLEKK